MGAASKYWRLVRIDAAGKCKTEAIASAEAFFHQQFPNLDREDAPDGWVQRQLWQMSRMSHEINNRILAELCLRCFISNQIQQVCSQLEGQFGSYHGFACTDLLPFVLDDDGKAQSGSWKSFASEILQTFNPERSNLATWATRLVRQHRELNRFLLERGVYLISDWAILNDTNVKQLQRILSEFHQLTASEIQQASFLLEAYHAVYRRDRLQQRQAGVKGACPPPTTDQLQRMAQRLSTSTGVLSTEDLMLQLQTLSDRLRQYRIYIRSGLLSTESLDQPENQQFREAIGVSTSQATSNEDDQTEFLQLYRQQFLISLEQAIAQVTGDRVQQLQRKEAQKAQQFFLALQLFHCRGESMGAIATAIGLQAQYQVTRLLNLKALRTDIRQQMLKSLRPYVLEQAKIYAHPQRLQTLDQQIDIALDEQLGATFQEAEAEASSLKQRPPSSLFARKLCQYLDHQEIHHDA